MGPAGQREQGRASGACALRACLSGLTVGPGGEARERARGLGSGASGDRWLDWAGAGEAGPLVSGLGESRLGRAREGKEGVGRGFGWARKLGLGFALGFSFLFLFTLSFQI